MFARQNWSLSHQHQLCDVTQPMPEVGNSVPSVFFVTLLVAPAGQRWWCPVQAEGRAFT